MKKKKKSRKGRRAPGSFTQVRPSGGPAAGVASPLAPQVAPGHPPSSSGILGTTLLKATEMPGSLLLWIPYGEHSLSWHLSITYWIKSSGPDIPAHTGCTPRTAATTAVVSSLWLISPHPVANKITSRFLIWSLETKGQQVYIFKTLKEKSCQPRILYLPKLSFRNEGEMKTFPDKPEPGKLFVTKPALHGSRSFRLERKDTEQWLSLMKK